MFSFADLCERSDGLGERQTATAAAAAARRRRGTAQAGAKAGGMQPVPPEVQKRAGPERPHEAARRVLQKGQSWFCVYISPTKK